MKDTKKKNILKAMAYYDTEDLELMLTYLQKKQNLLVELMIEGLNTDINYTNTKAYEIRLDKEIQEAMDNGLKL